MTKVAEMREKTGSLPDLREQWAARLERVQRSQARVDPSGLTRPPRDSSEREFLERTGQAGPFVEVVAERS
jgi:hypothetical protein